MSMNVGTNSNVSMLLEQLAREQGSRGAIIDVGPGGPRVATYADLQEEVGDAAKILRQAGVQPLDVVLIYVPLQRELISLLLAVFKIGAQALFIDPSYTPVKVWQCLQLARPNVLVVDKRLQALTVAAPLFGIKTVLTFASAGPGGISAGLNIITDIKTDGLDVPGTAPVTADHPALITFTSGSTGRPKGIVRSHGFLNNQSRLLHKTLPPPGTRGRQSAPGHYKDDSNHCDELTVMTTLPMFILAALAAGQTAIIPAAKRESLVYQFKYSAIDRLLCAPHSLQNFCKLLEEEAITLPQVKQVIVGGGPVFPSLLAKVKATMPCARVITVYGSTEAEPICHQELRPVSLVRKGRGLPLGRPIDEVILHVIDQRLLGKRTSLTAEQFKAITLSPDKEGEIVVSGDHVVRGYLGGHGNSETKFEVAGRTFHRTGDAGYINDQGEVFLTGRVAYGVEVGARDGAASVTTGKPELVYPLAVECIAMDNQAIERCAFLSLEGKAVLALKLKVDQDRGAVLAQLIDTFARARISIDRFVVVKSLPLDERHQSKIVYSKLKRQLRFAS